MTQKKSETGWKRPVQEPTVTEDTSNIGGTIITHPAFAQISAHRISGHATLYGSDFRHQGFIKISIHPSTLRRSLSNDWAHASNQTLIEVELSEAQWAHFVSSLNCGSGTQCTLTQLGRDIIPGLPDPISRKDQFKAEAKQACTAAFAELNKLRAAISDAKLSGKAKEELTKMAHNVEARLTNSLPFVLDQFGEHMEKTTEKAKVEINAYATNAIMRAGIASLGGTDNLPLSLALDAPKDKPE